MKLHGKPCKMCTRFTVTRSGTGLHLLSAFLARNGGRSGDKRRAGAVLRPLIYFPQYPGSGSGGSITSM